MRCTVLAVLVSGGALVASGYAEAGPAEAWSLVDIPVAGSAQSIGSPAAGCISGAIALPADGDGYQVLRPQRNRFWAHPRTIAFIQELARDAGTGGGPLLIGDLSQPRGGPMAYGHGSHQHGLDVDIWFRLPKAPLSPDDLAQPVPVSMVKGTRVDPKAWGQRQLVILEQAARARDVDRIFVNPAIKAEACRVAQGDRSWLSKLRPWWGHDEHFHVRLACTPGDIGCTPQKPVPDGDGCGTELASWNARPVLLPDDAKDKPNHRRPVLPAACARVLDQPVLRQAGHEPGQR
jgi:penicillin-insensitive murein endopeptidase